MVGDIEILLNNGVQNLEERRGNNLKWYCYRNHKTGEEVKLTKEDQKRHFQLYHTGFKLIQIYDLSVTEKEKKAK